MDKTEYTKEAREVLKDKALDMYEALIEIEETLDMPLAQRRGTPPDDGVLLTMIFKSIKKILADVGDIQIR